jgi:hypothetical protein
MNLKGVEALLYELMTSSGYQVREDESEEDLAYLLGYKDYLRNTKMTWDISTRSFYEIGWNDAEGDHES